MLFLLLQACQGPDLQNDGPGSGPVCTLSLGEQVDFGEIEVAGLSAPVQGSFTLSNTGQATCELQDVSLDSQVFELGPISEPLLLAGASMELSVSYSPTTASTDRALLIVHSSDSNVPVQTRQVLGKGLAPVLALTPSELDFGSLYVGCVLEEGIGLENHGNMDLVVRELEFSSGSAEFALFQDDLGPLPWVIAKGDGIDLRIEYAPVDGAADAGIVRVESNDPLQAGAVTLLSGEGKDQDQVDRFAPEARTSMDILFTLDRSCSMYRHEEDLQDNFERFITSLASADGDYRVAGVVSNDGCILGETLYVDSSMSAAKQSEILEEQLCLDLSNCPLSSSNGERAFTLMEAALSSSTLGAGGCNEGLLREDADLHLVAISDEPEQSINPYTYYVSLFQGLKADPDQVSIHGVGGDYPGGCEGAMAFAGLYEASVVTGGFLLSICSADYGTDLGTLATVKAPKLTSLELSGLPVPETVKVLIDGVNVPSGWTYTPSTNTVDFESGEWLQVGSVVEVAYTLQERCEP